MVLYSETVRKFFSGLHDVALIEIVVIRCYFINNFIIIIIMLMNKVIRHLIFVCLCIIHQLAIYGY